MRKQVIIGNWKMFKTNSEAKKFMKLAEKGFKTKPDLIAGVAVSATLLDTVKTNSKKLVVSAQNVHFEQSGAYTGEISIPMLKDININYSLVGHSERREYFNDTDEVINKKVKALLAANMTPVLCCGESLETFEKGKTIEFVKAQLVADFAGVSKEDAVKVIVAYEPIWAIGTGKVATPEIAQNVCKGVRDIIADLYDQATADQVVIQYGGSVKPDNVKQILSQPDIDGALVGGASLEVDSFLALLV
ncbi:triosephosphate isomerase [Spiroplasma sp. TIUS-1]|uniref:triose-phosphate isomerase n=1 Tax=Spiroplasma sp. TIUS-1 TaxID=216963 RepID=UPI0013986E26|nr:triose-phosphate isomerase [Spiroplasma sp. TIUS-1]QHX35691.1 triosephosphate isomerase [Spiroplasma sp. TIUS-1]